MRISLRLTDDVGGLEVLHGRETVRGQWPAPAKSIAPGQLIHIRMPMDDDIVDVLGEARVSGTVESQIGARFDVVVSRVTRIKPSAEGFDDMPTMALKNITLSDMPPDTEIGDSPSEDFSRNEPSGIVGNLKEMSLTDVVQSMEIARKTVEIVISPRRHKQGSVFMVQGRVMHATVGEERGMEAFFILSKAEKGTFRLRFHSAAPSENIDQPTQYLLLEMVRRLDEERARLESQATEVALTTVVSAAAEQDVEIELDDESLAELSIEEHPVDADEIADDYLGDVLEAAFDSLDDILLSESDAEEMPAPFSAFFEDEADSNDRG